MGLFLDRSDRIGGISEKTHNHMDMDTMSGRNVLIVSVLLPTGVDLTLRSNTQRAIEVLGVCEQTVLQHVVA